MKPPVARSRTSASLIGVPLNSKSVRSFGERQLGDCELVFDRAGRLLGNFRLEQIAHDLLRLVASLDTVGHDFVEGRFHPEQLQLAHEIENLGAFHQPVLRKLS
jgi:hypothetical protein